MQLAEIQLHDQSTRSKLLYRQIRKYFDLARSERGWRNRKETIDMAAATFGVKPRTVETALAKTKQDGDVP